MSARANTNHSVLRAKFKVSHITHFEAQREVVLNPVYGEDGTANAQWSKWTPSGELKMLINNETAFEALEVGKEYFLDFIPAEVEKCVDDHIEYMASQTA